MRVVPVVCAVASLSLAGCMAYFDDDPPPQIPDPDPDPPVVPVELRACNATGFDFDSLEYSDFEPSGALADGACTSYQLADRSIYRYDFIRFAIGDDVFELFPIDFVGETPLSAGRWSYRLTILDYQARSLSIEPVED